MISIIAPLYYILIFYGFKYSGFGKVHDNFLSLKILNGLKGLASLSILIGHISLDHPKFRIKKLYLTPPGLGRVYPAFFFFCSGYGLMVSFKKKNNYLNNFIRRRFLSILIPYSFFKVICCIQLLSLFYNNKMPFFNNVNFNKIFYFIFLYHRYWFVLELMMFYLLFYIFFKCFKNRHLIRFLFILFSWILILVPTYYYKNKKYSNNIFVKLEYHYSIWSFVYGLLIGDYEENIIKFIKKFYYLFLILASLFPYYFHFFIKYIPDKPYITGKYYNFWFNCTKHNIFSILMYSCILILTMKIQINNIILDYLGKFTLENYLYHSLIINIYRSKQLSFKDENLDYKYFITIFVSLYYSEKMHYINTILIGLINKEDNKINENKENLIDNLKNNEKPRIS